MTARLFAFNTGSTIPGTEQVGNLAIGVPTSGFTSTGLQWWNGPNESLGYVIAHQMTLGNQPNKASIPAYLGFNRSSSLSEESFVELSSVIASGLTFSDGNAASSWLTSNGYWNSWVMTTPTPTITTTPTPTPSITPTLNPTLTPTPTISVTPTITPTISVTPSITPTKSLTPTPTITPTRTQTPTVTPTISLTPTITPTITVTPSITPTLTTGVTFSQAFTGGTAPSTQIETAWNTFRAALTGTYTSFTWSSTNGSSQTVTDSVKVQTLANALRNATVTNVTINSVVWLVGTGCGTPKIGGVAVEFSNIGSCSASSTYALRPMINNANWGGTNQSTVGAPSQTITLTFN